MESYHLVWLSVHPERTEQWLKDRMRDGFHIHHIDGNHANDDPKNLVLIESGDHMMLHNGSTRLLWRPPGVRRNGGRRKKDALTRDALQAQIDLIDAKEGRRGGAYSPASQGNNFATIQPATVVMTTAARIAAKKEAQVRRNRAAAERLRFLESQKSANH